MLVNCRSIRNKIADFQSLVESNNPDIILGIESWLTDDVFTGEVFQNNYTVFRRDRQGRIGGGVFIAVSDRFSCSRYLNFETNCEVVWCSVSLNYGRKVYVCSFYRPPGADSKVHSEFVRSMVLAKAQERQNVVIIGGDFNLPNINWSNINPFIGEQLDPLLDFFDKYPLEQIVSQPTRGNNTLDLIFTNSPEIIVNVCVEDGISDHKVVLSDINLEIEKNK